MKSIDAKNVIKTLSWVSETSDDASPILESKLNKEGMYECVINLPHVNKTVIGLGSSKLESIQNVPEKASDLIDEYLRENTKEIHKFNINKSGYVLEEDNQGNLYIHVNKEGAR